MSKRLLILIAIYCFLAFAAQQNRHTRGSNAKNRDFYKILEVPKTASTKQIKKAYRKLSKKYHPDMPTGDENRFLDIRDAHEVLNDKAKRKEYDRYGEEGPPPLQSHTHFNFGPFGGGGGDFNQFFGGGGGGGGGRVFTSRRTTHRSQADEWFSDISSITPVVSQQDLKRALSSMEYRAVCFFYDPRDKASQEAKEKIEVLAKLSEPETYQILAMNCAMTSCEALGISTLPTLRIYHSNENSQLFRSTTSFENIVPWIWEDAGIARLSKKVLFGWIDENEDRPKILIVTRMLRDLKFGLLKAVTQYGRHVAFGIVDFWNDRDLFEGISNINKQSRAFPLPGLLLLEDSHNTLGGEWLEISDSHVAISDAILNIRRHDVEVRPLTRRRMEVAGDCGPADSQFCFLLLEVPDPSNSDACRDIREDFADISRLHERMPAKFLRNDLLHSARFAFAFGIDMESCPMTGACRSTLVAFRGKRRKFEVLKEPLTKKSMQTFIEYFVDGGRPLSLSLKAPLFS